MAPPASSGSTMKSREVVASPSKADSSDTTLDCSFASADGQGESLTVSVIRLDDNDDEGLETPLNGAKYWAVKRAVPSKPPMTPTPNHKPAPSVTPLLMDPHESCEETTCHSHQNVIPVTPCSDPDDCMCVETTVDGILLQDQESAAYNKHQCDEEGVEMNLNDFQQETQLILLDLQGAEVATIIKKVRFEIDGEDDLSIQAKNASRNRRRQIVKFLRRKSKKAKSTTVVGCPSLVQMAIETEMNPPVVVKEPVCSAPEPISGKERVDHQASKFTGVVVELYDCFLKAVTESYLFCQYTGSYLEEQVLDIADTEFLRELLDDGTVDLFGDDAISKRSPKKKYLDDNDWSLAETFSFEVHVPSDEARGRSIPVIVKDKEESNPRSAYI